MSFQKTESIKISAEDKNVFVPLGFNSHSSETPSIHRTMEQYNLQPCGVGNCYKIKHSFSLCSIQTSPQVTRTFPESVPILEQEVQNLLAKGAICEVPFTKDGFYSRLFLIYKKDGNMRPVIDLSPLNCFIETPHFQMEHLTTVKSLLKQGNFMTKLDLKDAYLSGLNIAPSVFTRLMKPVAGFLRKRGIRLVLYLDDMLIIGSTPQETRQLTQMGMNLLESLGFIINKEKSVLTPTRTITFLGFAINSITMLFTLPSEKVQKLLTLCRQIRSGSKVLLRILAQLLGLLESYRQTVSNLYFSQKYKLLSQPDNLVPLCKFRIIIIIHFFRN